MQPNEIHEVEVEIPVDGHHLRGNLGMPETPRGLVVFAHGSGSGRHSPRNRAVAADLWSGQLGTLLLDLLTPAEARMDERSAEYRFDIGLLAGRLGAAIEWAASVPLTASLPIGAFGASTGAAAALVAAARHPALVRAVVSRGGRPDLAREALPHVQAPTLLIVGGLDQVVLDLNREAMERMRCDRHLEVIPGASHLFPEPGALERVAALAREWFAHHLAPLPATGTTGRTGPTGA
ncbi:MAG TPA: dienelactone hydrolase family protein [Gemmatimonadaceae bacterium]|nr:dienelactone hydrolase family protein [Gemmatimonadaceae bacterium]